MITHVFLRYAKRDEFVETTKRNWSPRTSYPNHPDDVQKKILPIIAEEYQAPDNQPVPVGMLLVYFSAAKNETQIPVVTEYDIRMRMPVLVECFD